MAQTGSMLGMFGRCLRAITNRDERTALRVDIASRGARGHQRLRDLALGDNLDLAEAAIERLDFERDSDVLVQAAQLGRFTPDFDFLRALRYPEDADFLRERLAGYPAYRDYDLSAGWPHEHIFYEVRQTSHGPDETLLEEACSCGMHRIRHTTVTHNDRCPECGGPLTLIELFNPWNRPLPPKPWYGYDAYSDPDYYEQVLTCGRCQWQQDEDFTYGDLETTETSYEWRP